MLYEYLHSLSFYQLEHVGKEGRIACESIFFGDLLATCDSKIETQDSISPWMKLPKSLRILEIRWNHQLLDEYASIWMEKTHFHPYMASSMQWLLSMWLSWKEIDYIYMYIMSLMWVYLLFIQWRLPISTLLKLIKQHIISQPTPVLVKHDLMGITIVP